MNKTEIIEYLVVVEARTSAINRSGYIAQLADGVSTLSDEPTAELFEALHEQLIIIHQVQLDYVVFEETGTAAEIRASHKRFIQRLQEIGGDLGVKYQEPDDPILREKRILVGLERFDSNLIYGVRGAASESDWYSFFKLQGELGEVVVSEVPPDAEVQPGAGPIDCQVHIELTRDYFPDKFGDGHGNTLDLRNLNHKSFLARKLMIADGVDFTLDGRNEYRAGCFYRLTFKARR